MPKRTIPGCRLVICVTIGLLLVASGVARGGACGGLEARLVSLAKREDYAAAARLPMGACSRASPHLLALQGFAFLRLAYQEQVAGTAVRAADDARRSAALFESYLLRSPDLATQEKIETRAFVAEAQALLRCQGLLQAQRFADALQVIREAQENNQRSRTRRDDALVLWSAQVLLQRAQGQVPARWLPGGAGAGHAAQVRADARQARTLCENLPVTAQGRFGAEQAACIATAQALEHAAAEAIRRQRQRRWKTVRWAALGAGLAGVALLSIGGTLWGLDGLRDCPQAPNCPDELATGRTGQVLFGVGGGLTGLGLIGLGVALGLESRERGEDRAAAALLTMRF